MSKILTVITTTYYAEKYLPLYFKGVLDLQGLDSFLFLLVMNEPSEEEKRVVCSYQNQHPDLFQIIEIPKRETIGASLNRGFSLVNTPYCSLLDVDDIRVPDSFLRQIVTLEQNPDIDLTYGDFIQVDKMGKKEGVYQLRLEYDPVEFQRNCWASPSQLFRTSILKKIGGFDEQFKSTGDLDFHIRAALNCKFKKTPGVLLYYTRYVGSGSSSSTKYGRIESAAIYLRFGIYDIILNKPDIFLYIPQARKYSIDKLLVNGAWSPIEQCIPNYRQKMTENAGSRRIFMVKWPLKFAQYYLTYPLKVFLRYVRVYISLILKQLGLFELAQKLVSRH